MDALWTGNSAGGAAASRARSILAGALVALLCLPSIWFVAGLCQRYPGATDLLALPPESLFLASGLLVLPVCGLWLVRRWLRMPRRFDPGL